MQPHSSPYRYQNRSDKGNTYVIDVIKKVSSWEDRRSHDSGNILNMGGKMFEFIFKF